MTTPVKPSKATVARTAVLFFALVNQTLVLFGKDQLPFGENEVYELVSWLLTAGSSLAAWWHNNSWTQDAILADCHLKMRKRDAAFQREGGRHD